MARKTASKAKGKLPDMSECKGAFGVHGMTPKCNRDPELRKWLDDLKAIQKAGESLKAYRVLSHYAKAAGFDISDQLIRLHIRGDCSCDKLTVAK